MRRLIALGLLGVALGACEKKEPEPVKPEAPATAAPAQKTPTPPKPTTVKTEGQMPVQVYVDPGADDPKAVSHAVAVLEPTAKNDVHGTIELEQKDDGLHLKAHVTGLPPGKHGFHIHLFGDCSGEDGKTAGTHFNFEGSSEKPPDDIKRITGNLGELEANKDGVADAEVTIAKDSLQGRFSVLGRAIIVHEKGNDPKSPPIGEAGSRLACGVIGIAEG